MARGQNVQPSSCFLDTSYKLASSKTDYSFVGNKTNMQSYFMPGIRFSNIQNWTFL